MLDKMRLLRERWRKLLLKEKQQNGLDTVRRKSRKELGSLQEVGRIDLTSRETGLLNLVKTKWLLPDIVLRTD